MKGTVNTITIGGVKLVIGEHAADNIAAEFSAAGLKKALIVTDPSIRRLGLCDAVVAAFEESQIPHAIFDQIPSDPPARVVAEGAAFCKAEACDGVVGIGGGSVLDAAKCIKMMATHEEGAILDYKKNGLCFQNPGLPLFSIPTTSGTGSEVTQYAVITDEARHVKVTIGDVKLVSAVALLDPLMTKGLPPRITAATALDAMAHAIEAYTSNRVLYARGSTVFSDAYDLEAIRLISGSLRKAVLEGSDLEARKQVMVGATMAGFVSQAGSGAAHGIGTALGALYHVPHGDAVGVMLPYVMEYNVPVCPERFRSIAAALGVDVAGMDTLRAAYAGIDAMKQLLKDIGFVGLAKFVPDAAELPALAAEGVKDHCCALNAKPLDNVDDALQLLQKAWNQE